MASEKLDRAVGDADGPDGDGAGINIAGGIGDGNGNNNNNTNNNTTGTSHPNNHQHTASPSTGPSTSPPTPDKKKDKKPFILKRIWTALDLDIPTLLMMAKAGIPPTIALAMYRSDEIARTYTTLGYLVAIISILGFCIMPRAKFIQTMIMNILATCVGSGMAMLMVWSAVKAREHSTPPGARPALYNSSQSAVLGVWLFFNIYFVNALKAKYPQLAFPAIIYSIMANVAASNGSLFRTVPQCETFIRRLFGAFMTGLAIATGVSLFIVPVTCRKVVGKEMTGYLSLLRGTLGAQKRYIQSMEGGDMFDQKYVPDGDKEHKKTQKPEVAAIKTLTRKLQELHGKLGADLPFAKRELAYGKLTPDDLEEIFKNLRKILLPVLGLSSVVDLFERAAEVNHWEGDDMTAHDEITRAQTVSEWNEMFSFIHEPFESIFQALDDGLAHTMLRLGFAKPPKKKKGHNQADAEAKGDMVKPGDEDFTKYFETQAMAFVNTKEPILRHWVQGKGIELEDDYFSRDIDIESDDVLKRLPTFTTRKRDQRQLYMLLYLIFTMNAISRATLDMIYFADAHDQAKAKNRVIAPGVKRFKKWVKSVFASQDSNEDDETTIAGFERNSTTVSMGEAYSRRKDPEHLPPANVFEKFGNWIRGISHFLRSPESAFGLRVAIATMSVAIMAFLRPTQVFFIEQRLVWALIMVAISMTPTAGQSIFQFILRIGGTLIAMIVAWLIWYIPGKQTAGIIVFEWFFVSLGFYIPLKRLDLAIAAIISVVTATLIVGYELQVRKLGVKAAEAGSNQPAYPIYELGPYRLATVVGGLVVAFIWTIFPYPITEHSVVRNKLGGSLYLSANLYSVMHEQVMSRIRGDGGDEVGDKESPGYALTKVRNKVLMKQILMLQALRMHANFVRWEFPLGGKFPIDDYKKIIELVQNITNYTALMGYASQSFTKPMFQPDTLNSPHGPKHPVQASPEWFEDFRRVIGGANVTSHEITSMLSMLSSAISNGQPLPPYLHAPPGYQLSQKLELVDHDILSLRNIAQPGYASFAVMAICTRCIHMDLERLLVAVKKLVGELDFSFHVVSTKESSPISSSETLTRKSTGERSRKQD